MRAPDYLLKQGVTSLVCVGDGRQSGTSGSPSILNASPGGGLGRRAGADRDRRPGAARPQRGPARPARSTRPSCAAPARGSRPMAATTIPSTRRPGRKSSAASSASSRPARCSSRRSSTSASPRPRASRATTTDRHATSAGTPRQAGRLLNRREPLPRSGSSPNSRRRGRGKLLERVHVKRERAGPSARIPHDGIAPKTGAVAPINRKASSSRRWANHLSRRERGPHAHAPRRPPFPLGRRGVTSLRLSV